MRWLTEHFVYLKGLILLLRIDQWTQTLRFIHNTILIKSQTSLNPIF